MRLLIPLLLAAGVAAAGDAVDIRNPDLNELSGLAVSRADPGLLWGHNDTGDGAVLYRIGPAGEDLGALRVEGAQATDWEDIAAFDHRGRPALLIADTGDNLGVRAELMLYAVTDPGRDGRAELLWRLPFRFPDGARDCEAIAVDGSQILLVSKRDHPPRLYRLALPARTPAAPQVAEFLGELGAWPKPARLVRRLLRPFADSPTALDVSRDGAIAVIATPARAYVYRRAPGAGWAQVLAQPAAVVELPELPQVEAAALSPDGRELIVGSEGRPGRLTRIALPQ